MTFLDVGTGTGILAIAAARSKVQSLTSKAKRTSLAFGHGTEDTILACDTDLDSVKIAKENAAANGVADEITFLDSPIDDKTPAFDFVCANLTIDVIVPIFPLLLEKSRRVLVLSGILVEQTAIIEAELLKYQISTFGWVIGDKDN